MYVPQLYAVALSMLVLTMFCWGCWLSSFDSARTGASSFSTGITFGAFARRARDRVTLGRTDPPARTALSEPSAADSRHLNLCVAGGGHIHPGEHSDCRGHQHRGDGRGLSHWHRVGAGDRIMLNYVLKPVGNPMLLFWRHREVCLAIGWLRWLTENFRRR